MPDDVPFSGVEAVRVLVKLRGLGTIDGKHACPIEAADTVAVLEELGALEFLRAGDVLRCERKEDERERERILIAVVLAPPPGESPAYLTIVRSFGLISGPACAHDEHCTWRLVNHVA